MPVSVVRVLGVDHGLHHTGYGVLQKEGNRIQCLCWGSVDTKTRDPFPRRLHRIYEGLMEIIGRWEPSVMAVEAAIYAQNVRTAISMGHARGAALLAGAHAELEIFEYSPKKVKSSVVGNGAAAKEQVRFMVSRILNLPLKKISLDASDALAVGLCHLNQTVIAGK